MSDIFEELIPTPDAVIDPEKDYSEELIGEGKPYVDLKAAARALVEKEAFIARLKKEREADRQSANAQQKLEELVTKLSQVQSPSNEPVETGREQDVERNPVDIEAEVNRLLTQREVKSRQETNAEKVKKELRQTFGPNYVVHVQKIADDLGMTNDQMNAIARESPAAFMKLVADQQQRQSLTLPQSSIRSTQSPAPKGEKTQSYYKNLLRTDRNLFLSPRIQNEMHAQAHRLGEAFFDADK